MDYSESSLSVRQQQGLLDYLVAQNVAKMEECGLITALARFIQRPSMTDALREGEVVPFVQSKYLDIGELALTGVMTEEISIGAKKRYPLYCNELPLPIVTVSWIDGDRQAPNEDQNLLQLNAAQIDAVFDMVDGILLRRGTGELTHLDPSDWSRVTEV